MPFESSPNHYETSFAVLGEPHFHGFDGKSFDYQGQPTKLYNIITTSFLQLNSLFTTWHTTPHATVMTNIGLKIKTNKELIKIKLDSDGKSYINDFPDCNIKFNDGSFGIQTNVNDFYTEIAKTKTSGSNIGIGSFIHGYFLHLNDLKLIISYETYLDHTYYNIMGTLTNKIEIDGIVGRTANVDYEEIDLAIYEVSSLFADDFKFNLFKS